MESYKIYWLRYLSENEAGVLKANRKLKHQFLLAKLQRGGLQPCCNLEPGVLKLPVGANRIYKIWKSIGCLSLPYNTNLKDQPIEIKDFRFLLANNTKKHKENAMKTQ